MAHKTKEAGVKKAAMPTLTMFVPAVLVRLSAQPFTQKQQAGCRLIFPAQYR
jgi:hypothetical protein